MKRHAEAEQLSGYIDAALGEDERRNVEDHLAGCGDCRGRLEGLRRVAEQIRELDRPSPPGDLAGRVARRLRDERRATRWLDRLEGGLAAYRLPSGLLGILGVVVALAILAYLVADATARHRPPAESVRPAVIVQRAVIAGRTFVPAGDGWIEEGAPPGVKARIVDVGSEEGRPWLEARPELAVLARLQGPVTLEVDGEWWRLEFPPPPSGSSAPEQTPGY